MTEIRASGIRIHIYTLVKGSTGSMTVAMQKCHVLCETSLAEISSMYAAAGSVGVGSGVGHLL